jgi:hypothetical protein
MGRRSAGALTPVSKLVPRRAAKVGERTLASQSLAASTSGSQYMTFMTYVIHHAGGDRREVGPRQIVQRFTAAPGSLLGCDTTRPAGRGSSRCRRRTVRRRCTAHAAPGRPASRRGGIRRSRKCGPCLLSGGGQSGAVPGLVIRSARATASGRAYTQAFRQRAHPTMRGLLSGLLIVLSLVLRITTGGAVSLCVSFVCVPLQAAFWISNHRCAPSSTGN